MPLRVEDYAMIGDCETAALVGRDGSIDWLCFPRFYSDACFAALLGDARHGLWSIAPVGEVTEMRRRYRDDTLILETELETAEGAVRLIDLEQYDSANARQCGNFPQAFSHFALIFTASNFASAGGTAQQAAEG